jgi:hypothetical protein
MSPPSSESKNNPSKKLALKAGDKQNLNSYRITPISFESQTRWSSGSRSESKVTSVPEPSVVMETDRVYKTLTLVDESEWSASRSSRNIHPDKQPRGADGRKVKWASETFWLWRQGESTSYPGTELRPSIHKF